MAEIAQALADLAVTDRSMIWNTDLVEALELDNPIGQAAVVLHSTLDRTESRCARSREDHPKRDDENWLKHTLAGRDDADRVRLGDRPVRLHPLSNAAFQPSQARLLMRLGVAYAGLRGRAGPPIAVNLFTAIQISVGIGPA